MPKTILDIRKFLQLESLGRPNTAWASALAVALERRCALRGDTFHVPGFTIGKKASVSDYSLSGTLVARTETKTGVVDLKEVRGLRKGVHILKVEAGR